MSVCVIFWTIGWSGIGFAIGKKLASEGAKIVISSRKESHVNAAVENLKKQSLTNVIGVVCHVAKPEERINLLKKAEEAFGSIDILVSNAAVNPAFGLLENCSESAFDKIMDVNLKAPFLLTKEVLPYFRKKNSGNVIYISSIAGFQPLKMLGAYAISKTALFGMTKLFSCELAPYNIRVNCVAPGLIKTTFSNVIVNDEKLHSEVMSSISLNRMGEPEELGGIVAFLCSNEASYITGETIAVGGGLPTRL